MDQFGSIDEIFEGYEGTVPDPESIGEYDNEMDVDTFFSIHPDMKSRTGAVMIMGAGAIVAILRKTKVKHTEQYGSRACWSRRLGNYGHVG